MRLLSRCSGRRLFVITFVMIAVLGAAAVAQAVIGGTVPSAQGVTFEIPTTHITGTSQTLVGTYPTSGSFPTEATLAGSLAARSTTGEEHVHCDLTVGTPARVVGSFDQAGIGANLPSTTYATESVSITGTYTAAAGEALKLSCATTGALDVILTNTHVVLQRVTSQSGGA